MTFYDRIQIFNLILSEFKWTEGGIDANLGCSPCGGGGGVEPPELILEKRAGSDTLKRALYF